MQDAYAISSTLYVMVLSPTCPTWCNYSSHQVVKTTTFVFCSKFIVSIMNVITTYHYRSQYLM